MGMSDLTARAGVYQALLYTFPFLRYKKELVTCTWACAFLTHVRTSNLFLPTDRQTKPYSLLPYNACALENEAFCFQALPCGQNPPRLGCIPSLQAVQGSKDTNYMYCYSVNVSTVKNFEVLLPKRKEGKSAKPRYCASLHLAAKQKNEMIFPPGTALH